MFNLTPKLNTMSEQELSEFVKLKKELKQSVNMAVYKTTAVYAGIVIIILMAAVKGFNNHEGRISSQETITKDILDNSGVEMKVRSVTNEIVDAAKIELNQNITDLKAQHILEMDKKVDKSAFDIMYDDVKHIKNKIDIFNPVNP